MIVFGEIEGSGFSELGTLNSADIMSDSDSRYVANGGYEESFTANIAEFDKKLFRKIVLPKGYRNADVLKRDGYLSPKNMEH